MSEAESGALYDGHDKRPRQALQTTFLEKSCRSPRGLQPINRADAKKPGISRLPHDTHVLPNDHPTGRFCR
ncbi:hypothetical protein, partial [Pseudomonas viridiflava]|uniref:hypothetical protein n=1 Tax=Pseudomonas viridiflava TaxID=33069 RepID=UPI00197F865C